MPSLSWIFFFLYKNVFQCEIIFPFMKSSMSWFNLEYSKFQKMTWEISFEFLQLCNVCRMKAYTRSKATSGIFSFSQVLWIRKLVQCEMLNLKCIERFIWNWRNFLLTQKHPVLKVLAPPTKMVWRQENRDNFCMISPLKNWPIIPR